MCLNLVYDTLLLGNSYLIFESYMNTLLSKTVNKNGRPSLVTVARQIILLHMNPL